MEETQQGKMTSSRRWWFESHSGLRQSPWLRSTLSELDEKTEAMLKLIEEDADSFAKRAEMYYKKRPELITMVEDLYRTHRSLVERFDQLKTDSGTTNRVLNTLSLQFPLNKSTASVTDLSSYGNFSDTNSDLDESDESEVDDPDPEFEIGVNDPYIEEQDRIDRGDDEAVKLREEVERLKEEVREKDEEKREVIRQLSMAMGVLKEENLVLRRRVVGGTRKRWGQLEFFGKLFNGNGQGKPRTNVVAL